MPSLFARGLGDCAAARDRGVQVRQYGDDPEVEPGQAAMRVFFDWPGWAGSLRGFIEGTGANASRDQAPRARSVLDPFRLSRDALAVGGLSCLTSSKS